MKNHFLFCLVFLSFWLTAQEPVSIQITEKDGLPDKEFYGIAEDSKGFIWLAGNSGLTRYNGKEYKTYNHLDKRGLSVFELNIDTQDRVWCINISGQIFYVENDEMHLFKDLQKELNGTLPDLVIADQYLVVTTNSETQIFDTKSVKNKLYKKYKHDPKNHAYVAPLRYEESLLFNDEMIFQDISKSNVTKAMDLPEKLLQESIENRSRSNGLIWDKLIFLVQNNEDKNSLGYLYKNDKWLDIKLPFQLNKSKIVRLRYIQNKIWIATDQGLLVCNIENNILKIEQHLFPSVFTTDVVIDRDNNYWISTLDQGVFFLPNIYIRKIDLSEILSIPTRTIQTSNDQLIIGFKDGQVIEYTPYNSAIRYFEKSNPQPVNEIVIDDYRKEYLVIQKEENASFSQNKLRVTNSKMVIPSLKKAVFLCIDSLMSVSTFDGRQSLYPNYEINSEDYSSIYMGKRGYTCFYDHRIKVKYFGMVDELITYDSQNNKKSILNNGDQILARTIIGNTNTGVWVATFSKGILFVENGNVIKQLTVKNGLLSNIVEQIAVDGKYLWIATKNGIQKMDTSTMTFQNLTRRDGILSYDIHDIIIQEDHVLFSSSDGLFTVDKNKAFKKFRPLDVYITDITINDQKRSIDDSYEIDTAQSAISISFNSNGYRSTSGSYEYRMLGLEKKWLKVVNGSNQINYSNLPKGNFTFQLKATDAAKGTNPLTTIKLSVFVPFYKQAWFWLLLVTVLLAVVILYYRRKLRFRESEKNKQLSQLQQDKEMINLKLENLRSQMNPHFVFNALNSIQDYIVRNHKNLASDYLGKFADLIRTYLEHSVKSRISLAEEIETLEMYLDLEKLRFEDKLFYKININSDQPAQRISIPTMLVQPYVENALKHGLLHKKDDRRLDVTFNCCDVSGLLTCTITDNGVGRKKAQEIKDRNLFRKDSFATKATEDRLQLLNYGNPKNIGVKILDLSNNDGATGTKVVVTIPYKITGYESDYN